eukprot:3359359-Rhodomonas_salina.2
MASFLRWNRHAYPRHFVRRDRSTQKRTRARASHITPSTDLPGLDHRVCAIGLFQRLGTPHAAHPGHAAGSQAAPLLRVAFDVGHRVFVRSAIDLACEGRGRSRQHVPVAVETHRIEHSRAVRVPVREAWIHTHMSHQFPTIKGKD